MKVLVVPAARFALIAIVLSQSIGSANSQTAISYDRQVRSVLSENCFSCHGFDSSGRQADLRLDTREGALDSGSGDAIVPGDPGASQVVERIFSTEEDIRMPPPSSGKRLSDQEKRLIEEWILQGAHYDQHWAFIPPKRTKVADDAEHPIDTFVRAALSQIELQPSKTADPETLLRRLSLDLTGLPPEPAQIDGFLEQWRQSPESAYESTVDRLLASPHYGERFGRWWLDQARYADSNGYSIDAPREIWLYRDWVVQALNDDLPFDQFTIEQIAGDLLPNSSDSQRVATGFHRNTQINKEGGIDPEQFRIESIFDRVATTGTVWLGLTIGCAQCHDHKFDPVSQEDYYRLFAFFNNQDEPQLKIEIAAGQTVSTLVLKERSTPRETCILVQGDFTRPAAQVLPGTPNILHPLEKTADYPTRLELARWLVDSDNPLTARVIVNRLWLHFFGRGLVESENDFGMQGSFPSHPELLDWLAVEFMDSGWSLKKIHRLIVTSSTYRQSSNIARQLEEKDPNNLLLGRQTRLRLDAEVVRDVALTASGLMNPAVGGPPVFPPIPDGVMKLGQVNHAWKTSQGGDRYRRGMYAFVFRATPPPSLNVFDAPDGFQSCTRRSRSNTPLQALTLLNDSGFFEFAQALSGLIADVGIPEAFRRCTSRYPNESELAVLESLDTLTAARVLLNLDETITRE